LLSRRALYRPVVGADLEAIVAKHLADAHQPKLARWDKTSIGATGSAHGNQEKSPDARCTTSPGR
jgi:hypothetical protein